MAEKNYESTVMRMAGNIAASLVRVPVGEGDNEIFAEIAVGLARAIVAEVKRTEAPPDAQEAAR